MLFLIKRNIIRLIIQWRFIGAGLQRFYMKNANVSRLGGFTLIELLVVVLIIGILAAVALPQYQKAVAKSRFTEAIVNLKALKQAKDVCVLGGGDDCGDIASLDVQVPETANFILMALIRNWAIMARVRVIKKSKYVCVTMMRTIRISVKTVHWFFRRTMRILVPINQPALTMPSF